MSLVLVLRDLGPGIIAGALIAGLVLVVGGRMPVTRRRHYRMGAIGAVAIGVLWALLSLMGDLLQHNGWSQLQVLELTAGLIAVMIIVAGVLTWRDLSRTKRPST